MTAAQLVPALLLLLTHAVIPGSAASIRLCVTDDPPTIFPTGASLPDVGTTWAGAEVAKHLQGMGIDLIQAVFGHLLADKYSYTTTYVGGFSEALYQARVGICDVSVNSFFTAYSRSQCSACPSAPVDTSALVDDFDWEAYACCIDFSHAYFPGGWSLLTRATKEASIDVFAIIQQKAIIQALCLAVLLTFAVAHLMWLCERTVYNDTEDVAKPYLFARKYMDGLRDGTWFASTTVMSNALHNKTIVTGPGRLVAAVWVAFGMFMTAFVTSIFSATLTAQQLQAVTITTAGDMAGRTMCLMSGYYNLFWDLAFPAVGVRKMLVDDVSECYAAVLNGSVDAAFSIRETFIAYFATGAGADLAVTPVIVGQDYAIAWGANFTGRQAVNGAILNWMENFTAVVPAYKTSAASWYGGDAGVFVYGSGTRRTLPWDWPLITATCVIVGVYIAVQAVVIIGSWAHRRYNPVYDLGSSTNASSALSGGLSPDFSLQRKHHMSFLTKASTMLSSTIQDHDELKRSQSQRRLNPADSSSHHGFGGGSTTTGTTTTSATPSMRRVTIGGDGSNHSGTDYSNHMRGSVGGEYGGSAANRSVRGGSAFSPTAAGSGCLVTPFSRDSASSSLQKSSSRTDVQMTVVTPRAAQPRKQSSLGQLLQAPQSPPSPLQQALLQQQAALLQQLASVQRQLQQAQPQQQQPLGHQRSVDSPSSSVSAALPSASQVLLSGLSASYAEAVAEDAQASRGMVDEVVTHLETLMRAHVGTQVREAMAVFTQTASASQVGSKTRLPLDPL